MLVAAAGSGTSLLATQDETDTESEVEIVLAIPADTSIESIEELDMDLAKSVGPQLTILFDGAQSADARKAAADAVQSIAGNISDSSSLPLRILKRRLLRRAALLSASIQASEAESLNPASDSHAAKLVSAVNSTEAALNAMSNGGGWVDYLHLAELKSGTTAAATKEQVVKNLSPSESMDSKQLAFLKRPAFQNLKAALEMSLAAEAYANDEAAARKGMNEQINSLVTSLLAYEKKASGVRADEARTAWRSLRTRFPAAAEVIRPVVNEHYFNHNVHFTISEDLLSRLVSDYRTESGCIADCILGAWVTGSQTTNVDVRADIRPSLTSASFDLLVSGNTQSNTKAQKSPAVVWTNGNHYFWISRSVYFDGRHITTSPAAFSANTNSRTVGLATKYDNIPIVRGIVRKIANQKIAESKPKSDALTVSKMRDEALPKFQSESDEQFASGNETISKMLNSLERRGVPVESISARSSNTQIAVSARTIGVNRLGGSPQPPAALIATGAAAQIHESALNNAIDALGFQGRDIPEKDFAKELESALSDLLQRDISLKDEEPAPAAEGETEEPPTVFLFSKTDPIRVRFNDGQVVLSLRMGIRQEGKEEIPVETVTIPISMSLQDGKIILEPGNIAVTGRPTRSVQIKRVLARRIVRKEMSPTVDLEKSGNGTLPVTVTHLELADGWLTAELQ